MMKSNETIDKEFGYGEEEFEGDEEWNVNIVVMNGNLEKIGQSNVHIVKDIFQ